VDKSRQVEERLIFLLILSDILCGCAAPFTVVNCSSDAGNALSLKTEIIVLESI